ncbi:uncharacterized protein (DUF302 family) [Paenibacillus taihuensis]|uniref:Uncharacterized protein (DUF302 family) n=1 Tax=Paenibacillus taihuensis TaxID=1156355 RepID=A0A3D9QTQ7_9BACL|nr:DUF302 domain-containing protein [Paenibacillus taihuensis]REE66749.1 uncharacterized protein (DUF302 family) [Paenibacillus taihuensis]
MFHYTVESSKTLEQAIEALKENLKAEKFGVLWELDLKEKLREKGVDFDMPYHILEVCNPEEAKRVLSENALVGYFLPCKLVVYIERGVTKIGMPKPSALIELVENEVLKVIAADIEKRLTACVDKSI